MKKIFKLLALAALAFSVSTCAQPDADFIHDDVSIWSIYIYDPSYYDADQGKMVAEKIAEQIQGILDETTGEITFSIPKKQASYYKDEEGNVRPVKVKASVNFDTTIEPSLLGLKDLNEPMQITVTANQTGRTAKYSLQAFFTRN